jgi:hypothetical protein
MTTDTDTKQDTIQRPARAWRNWYKVKSRRRNGMSDGNNLYDPHPLMIDSGTFWRCDHGTTGFGSGMVWKGCRRCAIQRPRRALRSWLRNVRSRLSEWIEP